MENIVISLKQVASKINKVTYVAKRLTDKNRI